MLSLTIHFHFTPERLYGTRENLGRYDMIEVIQIGLGTDIKDNTLLGFLYVLFKYQGTLADKKKLLETRPHCRIPFPVGKKAAWRRSKSCVALNHSLG